MKTRRSLKQPQERLALPPDLQRIKDWLTLNQPNGISPPPLKPKLAAT